MEVGKMPSASETLINVQTNRRRASMIDPIFVKFSGYINGTTGFVEDSIA